MEGGLRDQTYLTTRIILNPKRRGSHGELLYQWDRSVGTHLGRSAWGGLIAVHAGLAVYWDSFMFASLGTHFGGSAVEN